MRKIVIGLGLALALTFAGGIADAVSTGPLPDVAAAPQIAESEASASESAVAGPAEASACSEGAKGAACTIWLCADLPCCPGWYCDEETFCYE